MPEPITTETDEDIVEQVPAAEEAVVAETAATDNSEAEMDAVLDKLLASDFPEPTGEPAAPEPPANDAEYEKAIRALKRDGVPDDVIDGLKSNPSKVKEWGLKAAKRQSDVDAFGAKVAAESKKTEPKPSDEPKAAAKTDDKEADADPLSEFSTIFGEEAVKPLKAMQQRMEKAIEERTKALELKYESKMAYDGIRSKYGVDAPPYEAVLQKAAEIGRNNPSSFNSLEEIIGAAFKQIAGEPKAKDMRSISRPSVGKAPARSVAKVDKEDMVLDILLSGGTRDDVRKAITR